MNAQAWIALAGLILTFVISPLAILAYRFFKDLNRKVDVIHSNHIPHVELYLRLICEHLGIPYSEPRDK